MHKILLVLALLVCFMAACRPPVTEFVDGDLYTWEEAMDILHSGAVEMVFQGHNLLVTFTLRDGRVLHAVEPYIDAIFDEIEACGMPCAAIVLATE